MTDGSLIDVEALAKLQKPLPRNVGRDVSLGIVTFYDKNTGQFIAACSESDEAELRARVEFNARTLTVADAEDLPQREGVCSNGLRFTMYGPRK